MLKKKKFQRMKAKTNPPLNKIFQS